MTRIREGLEAAGLPGSLDELNFGQLFQVSSAMDDGTTGPRLRFDLVEFELRHLKEHVDKLKFNYLEMSTKQHFMHRLLDADEWNHLYNSAIWTPADMRSLERQGEGVKAALVAAKGRCGEVEGEVGRLTEHLVAAGEGVQGKMEAAEALEQHIAALEEEVAALRPSDIDEGDSMSAAPRSIEELQIILDDQLLALEKRRAAIDARKAANLTLSSHLDALHSDLSLLSTQSADLSLRLAEKERQEQDAHQSSFHKQHSALADWYRSALSLHAALTGISKLEMTRQDSLLIHLDGPEGSDVCVPVHLRVCGATGRLMAAQIGTTSGTPRRGQWRDVVEAAVEGNSIGLLVRQLRAALSHQ